MTQKSLWEILVPTVKMDGTGFYKTKYHRVWDSKVREIAGGLTVLSPVKGQWVSNSGNTFIERMIPVRIISSREEIEKIIDMTMIYYDQMAVLAYKISNEVILKERN